LDPLKMTRFFPVIESSAVTTVLEQWKALFPGMGVLALLAEADRQQTPVLQTACASMDIPLVGGLFPSLIVDCGFANTGAWLLCMPNMPYAALYDNLPVDRLGSEQIVTRMAQEIRAQLDDTPNVSLFMLFDAMVPNISTLLDAFYLQLANRVHYMGGCAGSETFRPMPCLFDAHRIVQNGVLLMLLKAHQGAILEHGYQAPASTVYATSTQGNCISQIDWRPAFEVYQELVQQHYQVQITRDNFYQHAVHFPFGIVRANHHVLVRIPVMLGDDDSLFCVGEVPANAVLTLLDSPKVDSLETMQAVARGLTTLNGDIQGTQLLFYCAGRRMHLGLDAATGELQKLTELAHTAQFVGALSLGEIGGSTVGGYPLFHNATLVAANWAST
jgi:hypothetical protein